MMTRAAGARIAVMALVGLLGASCTSADNEAADTTTSRPPPADMCEATARNVVDRLDEYLQGFTDITPASFLAMDDPPGLDDFQRDVRDDTLEGLVAGCDAADIDAALDDELGRIRDRGELGEFLETAIREGSEAPARDVVVRPGDDLLTLVASLGPGSTVTLTTGVHELDAPLVVDSDVAIVGEGDGITVLRTTAPDAAIAVIGRGSLALRDLTLEHTADNAASLVVSFGRPLRLEGVRVTGAQAGDDGLGGIGVLLSPAPDDDLTDDDGPVTIEIAHSAIVANDRAGVAVGGALEPVIRDNTIVDNGACGICWFDDAAGEARDNVLERNEFGVQVIDRATPLVAANELTDNTSAGMVIDGAAAPTATGNTLDGNDVGIQVRGDSKPILEDNTLDAHTIAISTVGDATATVIDTAITGAETGVVVGERASTTISGTSLDGGVAGVLVLGSGDVDVVDNVLRGLQVGIEVREDAVVRIEDNRLVDITSGAVLFGDRASGGVRRNEITGEATSVGIQVTGSAAPTIEGNEIVGGGGETVAILYADDAAGTASANRIADHRVGFQVGDAAAPALTGNTVVSATVAAFVIGGTASGRLETNTCPTDVVGILLGDEAAPDLGENDCTLVDQRSN